MATSGLHFAPLRTSTSLHCRSALIAETPGEKLPRADKRQYEYNYSLGELRTHLLESDEVVRLPNLSRAGARSMIELWNELKAAEGGGLWRSTTGLSGQILEAALKHKLTLLGVPPADLEGPDGTLGAILRRARQEGIYVSPGPGSTLTVGGSIFAAKQTRNVASHASPWQNHPSERRATLSIVLLICYLGHLYPPDKDVTVDREPEETQSKSPEYPTSLASMTSDGLSRAIRGSSPRMLVKLIDRAILEGSVGSLQRGIVANFRHVVANSGRGRVRNVMDLVVKLAQVGLRQVHSPTLAAVLPQDVQALSYLIERSPNRFSRYLYLCHRADPDMFEVMWQDAHERLLRKHIERVIDQRRVNLGNLGSILTHVPAEIRNDILQSRLHDLEVWVLDSPYSDSIHLLGAFASEDSRWTKPPLRSLIGRIAAKISASSDLNLAPLPLQLEQRGVLARHQIRPIVRALLDRTAELGSADKQRILWDLAAFSRIYRPMVASVANDLLADWPANLDDVDMLSMVGMLIVLDEPVEINVDASLAARAASAISGRFDRYRIARILLGTGFFNGIPQVPEDLRLSAVSKLRNTLTDGLSKKLVDAALIALNQNIDVV